MNLGLKCYCSRHEGKPYQYRLWCIQEFHDASLPISLIRDWRCFLRHRSGVASRGQPEKNSTTPSMILSESNIDHNLSSRAQRIASVPEEMFEAAIATIRPKWSMVHKAWAKSGVDSSISLDLGYATVSRLANSLHTRYKTWPYIALQTAKYASAFAGIESKIAVQKIAGTLHLIAGTV